ncbi:MAG: histidine phosphatase family protein [Deltaproteobacteria bacterium]|nr:histidine phosphatase family protein [Deltaproteobacteria bacterium]
MCKIYLIRHGQASFGTENYDKLSPLGVRQSEILAKHLHSAGFRPDAVYSGPLSRHKATADELYSVFAEEQINLPELNILNGFNEYDAKAIITATVKADPSLMEDLSRIYSRTESFKKVFSKAMLRWVTGTLDAEELESWKDIKERVAKALETIRDRHGSGETVAVFTSGGAIAASVSNALGLSDIDAMRLNWQIVNTSVTRYTYDDKRIALAGFNSIEHLSLMSDPSLITYW